MPHTYGVVPTASTPEHDEREAGDRAPLLGRNATAKKDDGEGTAGIPSGIGNLANTIIGSGMLSFPLVCAS
jgi:hypothetical protein